MPIKAFTNSDIKFLFGNTDVNKIQSKITELNKKLGREALDIEILDYLSRGRGVEAYNRLTTHRMLSTEYYSAFDFIKNHKKFDLQTNEGKMMHIYRNKNQYNKAPRTLKSMREFCKLGFFIEEGYSPCHNIPANQDTKDYRTKTLEYMIYIVRNKLRFKKTKYAALGNISFRGTPDTSFEGCQFVYNDKTGKLVVDNHNRGTWDYGKYGSLAHFEFDISPWLEVGNGNNVETEAMFLMSKETEKRYLSINDETIIGNVANSDEEMEGAMKNLIVFIRNFITNKNKDTDVTLDEDSIESLDTIYTGDEYLQKEQDRVDAIRENYINNFITKNTNVLAREYANDFNNIAKLITCIENKSVIKSIEPFVKDITINIDDTCCNYAKFVPFMVRNTLNNTAEDVKEGDSIDINVKCDISVYIRDSIKESLTKIANNPETINVYRGIIDNITNTINQFIKTNNISGEFRVLTDNIDNTFEKVDYSFKFSHIITHNETVICGKRNFTRAITDKSQFNLPKLPEENPSDINMVNVPKSEEALFDPVLGKEFFLFGKKEEKKPTTNITVEDIHKSPKYKKEMFDKILSEFKRAWNYKAYKLPKTLGKNTTIDGYDYKIEEIDEDDEDIGFLDHIQPLENEDFHPQEDINVYGKYEYNISGIFEFSYGQPTEFDSYWDTLEDIKDRWQTRLDEKATNISKMIETKYGLHSDISCSVDSGDGDEGCVYVSIQIWFPVEDFMSQTKENE